MSRIVTLLLIIGFVNSKRLLLVSLKERIRLEKLFIYEFTQCFPDTEQLVKSRTGTLWLLDIDDNKGISTKLAQSTCIRSTYDLISVGSTASELLESSKKALEFYLIEYDSAEWVMEYECLEPLVKSLSKNIGDTCIPSQRVKPFTSKTLFCALSQYINTPPSLDPSEASTFYTILETKNFLYFTRRLTDGI